MRALSLVRFAGRSLARDRRSGELRVMLAAVTIGVAAVSAVDFFVDRVFQRMQQSGAELIAADIAIRSSTAFPPEVLAKAGRMGLATAEFATMRSMVSNESGFQLSELKAVSEGYPLRGELRIRPAVDREAVPGTAPAPGAALVERRLLDALSVGVGDAVDIGRRSFLISGVLDYEPDRGNQFFNTAPRVMINLRDLPATGLVLPGSRVTYNVLAAGPADTVEAFRAGLTLRRGDRILDLDSLRPEISSTMQKARYFLGLSSWTCVLTAGIAVLLATRRFVDRHLDTVALLRVFGLSSRAIGAVFALELATVALLASAAGIALGYASHLVLVSLLAGAEGNAAAMPSLRPVLSGLAVGMVTSLGFALPRLVQLTQVPPVRVFRRDAAPLSSPLLVAVVTCLTAVLLMAPWRAGGSTVPLVALGATAACVALLAGSAALALLGVRRLVPLTPPGWRLGVRSATRHVSESTWQVTAIGLGVMALLLLAVVRVDVLDEWQAELPPDAPNHFLINLQPGETGALQTYLNRQDIRSNPLYPMVRARLTALNDAGIDLDSYEDPRSRQLMAREFNLTWSGELQDDNEIVAGRWWREGAREGGEFSVEADIAERMGIGIGDRLSYTVDGRTVTAPVTSIREVRWESFRPNFFVIASPGLLDALPATYMTSFYLDDDDITGVNDLVRTFPSVTVFAIDAILKQARAIVDRVTTALEFVYLFALVSSAVVLLAALQATLDERRYEAGLMKVFGATRGMLVRGAVIEPLVLGTVAGAIGGAIAGAAGVILAQRVFDVEVGFNPVLLPAGCLISWLVAYAGSFVTLRRVAEQPPGEFLRGR